MKKFYIFLLLISSLLLTGCTSKATEKSDIKKGENISITVSDVETKLKSKQSFLLKFTLSTCPHCIKLEKVQGEYISENPVQFFNVTLDDKANTSLENTRFMETVFPELKEVPTVYWISEGKIKDKMNISDDDKKQIEFIKEFVKKNSIPEIS